MFWAVASRAAQGRREGQYRVILTRPRTPRCEGSQPQRHHGSPLQRVGRPGARELSINHLGQRWRKSPACPPGGAHVPWGPGTGNAGGSHMFGKSTLRRARRSAMAVVTILAAATVVAPAAEAAVVRATPVPTYQTNGRVNAIVIQNGVIYLGGRFTAVTPAASTSGSVTRNHAAALSLATGQVLPWDPNVNGTVQSLAVGNGRVYLGGSFSNVGGTARTRLAAVDATSGAVITGFNPRADGLGNSLALSGNTLYAGGTFLTVAGTARSHLAAVDATTGALSTTWA